MKKEILTQRLKKEIDTVKLSFHLMKNFATGPTPNIPTDTGFREYVMDRKTREIIRTVEREAYSDTTVITERGADGRMHTHTETPIKQADGSYKIERDLPTVYQFQMEQK